MERCDRDEIRDCTIKLRENPRRRRERVTVGCGAGFGGDRPLAALKLLQRVKQLDYLVLECLAERTLVDRYRAMESGGDGYDSRISDWMRLLLPLALERGTRIITNMGAMDPIGAQEKVIETANSMGLGVSVGVAHEASVTKPGHEKSHIMEGGISTYLGAAPIVECLDKYQPNVVITSRVADAALFLAPMVYELGWNWDSFEELAHGSLAGHLLECGCQLTGGYFMHPGDKYRDMPLTCLLDLSLPYAEVSSDGRFLVAKAIGSGGVLNFSTCAQQLLYEVGDPKAYITPDIIIDLQDVLFSPSSSCKVVCTGAKPSSRLVPDKLLQLIPKDCGWKGWGEISYGGRECVKRATAAEFLVRSWLEDVLPGLNHHVLSYIIGVDSVKANNGSGEASEDVRLRMDGLFELEEQAIQFTREFTALYTNGPAGGGGISVGHKKEIGLDKHLVCREQVYWRIGVKHIGAEKSRDLRTETDDHILKKKLALQENPGEYEIKISSPELDASPAMSGQKIPLYRVAHGRAGDKGNNLNISVIPHFPPDIERLKLVVTPEWVLEVLSSLLAPQVIMKRDLDETSQVVTVQIYQVRGIRSLNIVIQNILDGGVNCSRWIDRHGKTVSDVILCQKIVLP